jgi:Subtilase family
MSVRNVFTAAVGATAILAGCKDPAPIQLVGLPVSLVAENGATILGTIVATGGTPYATFSRAPARSASLSSAPKRRFSPDRIIIGFKNDALGLAGASSMAYRSMGVARQAASRIQQSVTALSKRHALSRGEISPALMAARVRVDDPADIEGTMAALRDEPDVAWVERDEIITIRDGAPRPMSTDFAARADEQRPSTPLAGVATKFPSDPGFYEQLWTASLLDLPRAWGITTGSANVIVASVDMGIRFDHPEIAANLTNDGYDFVSQVGFGTTETICSGGTFTTIDGDGDGPDPDPTDPDDLEFNSSLGCWIHNTLGDHGLWTAGIIGGVGNDATGIAGVNWTVKIRPIRVLGVTGDGTNFDIAQGILYAAGLPAVGAGGAPVQAPSRAQIISMSLGGPGASTTLLDAVNAASAAGSLIVASAGNDGLDFPSYPAAFPNVMGVAAVGQDGTLATYSNVGTSISVSAPGGDFRLDDNGGGGVLGPGWNFASNTPTYLLGYGTSASAPFVSGIAALLLAQTPSLTAADLRSRIEQFATRPAGTTRSDSYGWGIANAYNALAQVNGPPHSTIVRLINSTTGAVVKTTPVATGGSFAFTRVATGTYYVQAGDDESGDGSIGIPGRRFAWAGGFGTPTVLNVNGNAQSVAIALGMPTEMEPNDDVAHANMLTPDSYVVGSITTPDVRDMYAVNIVTPGVYTIETSGLTGSCGFGIELDTFLSVSSQAGAVVGTSDNFTSTTSRACSRVQPTLAAGIYYITVTGSSSLGLADHGRYRLQIRTGT